MDISDVQSALYDNVVEYVVITVHLLLDTDDRVDVLTHDESS